MEIGLVIKVGLSLVGLIWPVVILWNRYLHSSLSKNREAIQDVRLEMAKNYVSNNQMDKFCSQMDKRFDRLEEKIDSK